MTASQKLGEKVYAEAQAAAGAAGAAGAAEAAGAGGGTAAGAAGSAGAAPGGKPADDNVVDAEFKEVKK
jgi:molecular chaperone DnaK